MKKKILTFFDYITIKNKGLTWLLLSFQLLIPIIYNKNFGLHGLLAELLEVIGVYKFFHYMGVQIAVVVIVYGLAVYRVIRKDYAFEKENIESIVALKNSNDSLKKENKLVKDLLDYIEIIVTEKRQRFSYTAERVLKESLSGGVIFQEITQPKSQMECIITNLKNYLSKQCDDNSIASYLFDVRYSRIGQMKLRNQKNNLDINCVQTNDDIQKSITDRNIVVVENVDNCDIRHSFSKKVWMKLSQQYVILF